MAKVAEQPAPTTAGTQVQIRDVTRRFGSVTAVEELLSQRPRSILCLLDYAGGVHLLDPLEGAEGKGSHTM